MSSSKLAIGEVFKLGRTPWKVFDPFLFCVYHRDAYPAAHPGTFGPDPKLLRGRNIGSDFSYQDGWSMYHGEDVPGFPVHPHRGFETISAMLAGMVDHSDSIGATGRFGNGDVMWMTAGRGIQHCEMMPLLHEDKPNTMEMFQIWLNLPAKSKMVPCHFKMIWNEQVPEFTQETGARVRVVAGKFPGAADPQTPPPDSWASQPGADVAVWILWIPAGGAATLPAASSTANRGLYMWGGDGTAVVTRTQADGAVSDAVKLTYYTGVRVDAKAAVKVAAEGGPCQLLVLQGTPIREPVANYGPFVMNTQEEITQAFADFRRTNFGGWKWGSTAHHHPRETPRFALYPDGHREEPPKATR